MSTPEGQQPRQPRNLPRVQEPTPARRFPTEEKRLGLVQRQRVIGNNEFGVGDGDGDRTGAVPPELGLQPLLSPVTISQSPARQRAEALSQKLGKIGVGVNISLEELARRIGMVAVEIQTPNMRPSEIVGTVVGRAVGRVSYWVSERNIPLLSGALGVLQRLAAETSLEEEVYERLGPQEEKGLGEFFWGFVVKRIPGIGDVIDTGDQILALVRSRRDANGKLHRNGGAIFHALEILAGAVPGVTSSDASGFVEGFATGMLVAPDMQERVLDVAALVVLNNIVGERKT